MDEGEAVSLIELVCEGLGREPPRDIVFRNWPHGSVNHGRGGRIVLPRSDFVSHYQMVDDDRAVRLLVLHEVAHYLMGPGAGHSPEFYALLFDLCRRHGPDLAFALNDETKYKKRNAPRGFALFMEGQVSL